MREHRFISATRFGIIVSTFCALAATQTALADQVSVTYGVPTANQSSNLVNVSGWIDLPIYGTKTFSTTTHVHGTIPAELSVDFDASTRAAALTGLAFVPSPGSLSFDNMSLHIQWSGFLAPSADATTNGLMGSLDTPNPPGPVASDSSPYPWDAYYHTNEMNSGTVNIVGHYLGVNHPIDINFNAPPYNTPQPCAANPGTTFGSVSIAAGSPYNVWSDVSTGYHLTIDYTTSLQTPLAISQEFAYDTGFVGTATGQINMTGGQTGNIVSTNSATFSHTFDYLPGDSNLSGTVDSADLNNVLSFYNQSGTWAQGDFDNSGVVDVADLNVVLSFYNQSLPPVIDSAAYPNLTAEAVGRLSTAGFSVVPEPGTVAMLAACLLALLVFARRKRIA